jgi:hypothetical protein
LWLLWVPQSPMGICPQDVEGEKREGLGKHGGQMEKLRKHHTERECYFRLCLLLCSSMASSQHRTGKAGCVARESGPVWSHSKTHSCPGSLQERADSVKSK